MLGWGPLEKRLALSLASLRTASLKGISSQLAARLSGSWVSVLLYRRPLSSIVSDLFAVGAGAEMNLENVVVPLTRKVSQELAMLAAVVPLLVTDVSAPVDREIFATDASLQKGAFVFGWAVIRKALTQSSTTPSSASFALSGVTLTMILRMRMLDLTELILFLNLLFSTLTLSKFVVEQVRSVLLCWLWDLWWLPFWI